MTRINLVSPSELSDLHLGAEYRELPRVFRLVKKAIARGERPNLNEPSEYVLGSGHVRFFYPRLGFIVNRFAKLVAECKARGRAVQYTSIPDISDIPSEWMNDYMPTSNALELNRARIKERTRA